jgi:hypothetical protein
VVSKDRIAKVAAYVDRLFESVAAEYEAGRMVSQFDERALPQSYRSDASFTAWRANVSDVYRRLSVAAVDVTMGGLGHYIAKDETAYCAGYSTCSTGGMVGAATTSLGVSLGRWAVLGEFMISDNEYSSRVSRLYDEDVAMRETRGAVMIRHTRPAGAFSTRVLGGLSYAVADRRGMDRVKEALVPVAGRHPIASRESRFGFIGGIDLVVGRRVGIVFPLRFNYALEAASPTWPSRMDAQAGVALTLRLFRSID